MTPQEIDDKIATNIMGWHKDEYGRIWLDANNESTGFVFDSLCEGDEVFGPTYDLNHAFMALHKWLEEHIAWRYHISNGWNRSNDEKCTLFSPYINYRYEGIALKNHEAQAICNCLLKATKTI